MLHRQLRVHSLGSCQCTPVRRVVGSTHPCRVHAEGSSTSSSGGGGSAVGAAAAASPTPPKTEEERFHEAYAKAWTMSQLYVQNRPPPVPLSDYEARRKKRDLEDIVAVRLLLLAVASAAVLQS